MSMKTAHKVLITILNGMTFLYFFLAAEYMVYNLATGGISGFIDSVIICMAAGFCTIIVAFLITFIFTAIWGRDVLR